MADDVPSLVEAGDIGYWRDEEARRAVEAFVPLHIPLWSASVGYRDILAEGITDLEVFFKLPQGSNPSWVSREQLKFARSAAP